MKKKTLKLLSLLLASTLVIGGCGSKDKTTEQLVEQPVTQPVEEVPENSQESTVVEEIEIVEVDETTSQNSGKITIAQIKEKYGTLDDKSIKPFYNVEQTTEFTFSFKSKVEPCLAVTVHTDPKCEVSSTVYQINDAYDNGSGYDIVVKPGRPVLNTNDRESGKLDNYNWGNAPVYYLSINYDMDASVPTMLVEPIIVPFTVRNDVSTPNVLCEIDTDGVFKITWKPIDGAVSYNIYEANKVRTESQASGLNRAECGYVGDHLTKIASVDGNTLEFKDFKCEGTDNTLKDNDGYIYMENFYTLGSYYVTAVDAAGNESLFSTAIEGWKYESQLPETFDKYSAFYKDSQGRITFLPETVKVQMADGSNAYLPINYNKIGEDEYGATYVYSIVGTKLQGQINYYSAVNDYPDEIKSIAEVPHDMFKIENNINIIPDNTVNTIANSENVDLGAKVERDITKKVSYSQDVLVARADLENARMIQDGIYPEGKGPEYMLNYGGLTENSNNEIVDTKPETVEDNTKEIEEIPEPTAEPTIEPTAEPVENNETSGEETTAENFVEKQIEETEKQVTEANNTEIDVPDVLLFADSAEEEYLTIMMAAGADVVNISAFPKLQNTEYLVDVIYKVIYQNPNIVGFEQMGYDAENQNLFMKYSFTPEEIEMRQVEVAKEAQNIIDTYITNDMTDEAKIEAIWKYFEDNTVYDTEACEAAIATNFESVDGYEDAFTTYGIMCKKVGVCQSYSYCTKLLCTMCGIECESLTGFLDKTLPHAWNIVQLDGKWYWLDTTNNLTNSGLPYMMYQSSSDCSFTADYVLDDFYALNDELQFVINSDNSKDWYYKNGLMIANSKDAINIITEQFNGNELIILKCQNPINVDDMFIKELATEFNNKGLSIEELSTCKLGYTGGLLILIKQ